ncbi:MAG: DUF58 domain-containing protein [Symploca sp. SIO3C6]|nr:DUF58 domain-containing protein [Symploca sp. SIO3C6]NET04110.1 DUF58 domain-containing protein [Symploca sp. SIO2B6]NET49446.1 DUF58 domain-containing protein [Merismopedia sp. SIO2A8]
MRLSDRITDWLETHWVNPAYAGWLLGAIAICFFGAATNTMAGWLYVISGIIFALLGIAAFLPTRSLRQIQIRRRQISPVSAGDQLTIEVEIENQTLQPQTLLQVQDILQSELGKPMQTAVEIIEPQSIYQWVYYYPTQQRGIFQWHEVRLRTATPLGLFWRRRCWHAPAKAIVYPTVLPLTSCPLVDEIGQEDSLKISGNRRSGSATEDLTKALRSYRMGDPTRLIHWRTSARHGELMVRELEVFTGSQEVIICLDSSVGWEPQDFEAAVITAASIYIYACRRKLNVKLWTPRTGLLHGNQVVLEALAATAAGEEFSAAAPSYQSLIWLTQNQVSINSLPMGSRWVLWSSTKLENKLARPSKGNYAGITINAKQSLQNQLQQLIKDT